MTTLNNKYKDNIPTNTIDNIINFFKKKNYSTIVSAIHEPVPNIWWATIELQYQNITIARANGKGASKEFALASGYSELYERYCNFSISIINKLNFNKMFKLNIIKNNYYFSSDEQIITSEQIDDLLVLKQFCNAINDDRNSLEQYLNSDPLNLLSLPFSGFNNNKTINIPFHLLNCVTGSSGMAAGNTIEEALTQGLSELCEHYVHSKIYDEKRPFYYIDINKIQLPNYLKLFFENLLKLNYKYFVYDFSYLYQVPVVGLLIVDTVNHVSYFDLGAAPVFSIALERCCTEIYQGYTLLGDKLKTHMILEKGHFINRINKIKESYVSFPVSNFYPDNFILNSIPVFDINKSIFLNDNKYSNKDLNLYYKNIFNHKNWEVYYRDMSQSNNIKAVRCYINNVDILDNIKELNNIPNSIKQQYWDVILKWESLINDYLNTKNLNIKLLIEAINNKKLLLNNLSSDEYALFSCFITDFFKLPKEKVDFEGFNFDILLTSLINNEWNILDETYNNIQELKFYLPLLQGRKCYSKEELIKISEYYGINYSEEDINNYNNFNYLIQQIYFIPYYNDYYGLKYEQLINTLIPLKDNIS